MSIGINKTKYIEYGKERLKVLKMQESMRSYRFNDFEEYDWNLTTDNNKNQKQLFNQTYH